MSSTTVSYAIQETLCRELGITLVFFVGSVSLSHIVSLAFCVVFCFVFLCSVYCAQYCRCLSIVHSIAPSGFSNVYFILSYFVHFRIFLSTFLAPMLRCGILVFIPSPTKLRRDIVTLPSVRPSFRPSVTSLWTLQNQHPSMDFYQTWYILSASENLEPYWFSRS
jgi:hypothetical protein